MKEEFGWYEVKMMISYKMGSTTIIEEIHKKVWALHEFGALRYVIKTYFSDQACNIRISDCTIIKTIIDTEDK